MSKGASLIFNGNTPQKNAIIKALNKLGCIHFNQLEFFMPPYKSVHENYSLAIANNLNDSREARLFNDCLVSRKMDTSDESMIDSIWVALDLIGNAANSHIALELLIKGDGYVTATYYTSSGVRYDFITVYEAKDTYKIEEMNRYYAQEECIEGIAIRPVIIIRDKKILEEIKKTVPEFPCEYAYLEGDYGDFPDVTYFKMEVQL